jgi:hypothetical protein
MRDADKGRGELREQPPTGPHPCDTPCGSTPHTPEVTA